MKITETLNEGLKRGYSIVITAKELDKKVDEKLNEAQPNVEMKGFRKGKGSDGDAEKTVWPKGSRRSYARNS
jgi:FKBP-type peptidyl-prolyl cis-trans isomerase (trigger factor)